MVKKIIAGILKKKEDSKEEVPDELPALGEETAPKEAPNAHQDDAKAPSEEPPEELPSLGEEKVEVKPELSDVRPAPKTEEEVAAHEEKKETGEQTKEEPKDGPKPPTEGFFSTLSKMLSHGKAPDSIVSQDLLANMKESWKIRKESDKTGLSSVEGKHVNTAINEVLGQLRLAESKWRAHKMVLEEDEKLLREQEVNIKEKEKQLKSLLRRSKLYQPVPEEDSILLKNSIPIKSLSEMINALRRMDGRTYSAHVNAKRNDFCTLAAAVDKKLGEELKRASSKEAMVKALDDFVKKLS